MASPKPRDPFVFSTKEYDPTISGNRIVAGTYIPQQLSDKLAIQAVLKAVPKSQIIETALSKHLETCEKNEERILQRLVERAVAEWESYKRGSKFKENWKPAEAFENYLRIINKSLSKRGIPRHLIEKILLRVVR